MASCLLFLLLAFVAATQAQPHLRVFDLHASNLPSDFFSITDGYVKVYCGPGLLGTTDVRKNNKNPWWEEDFAYENYMDGNVLRLEVYDDDIWYDDLLGVCQRPLVQGTHSYSCPLVEGGTLHYSYTLS